MLRPEVQAELDKCAAELKANEEMNRWWQIFCASVQGAIAYGEIVAVNGQKLALEEFATSIADACVVEAKKRGRL